MADPHDPDLVQMSFGDHLEELRRRIILSLVGIVLASIVTFIFGRDIAVWLCQPLIEVERNAGLADTLYASSLLTGFTVYMKVSLVAALIISAPWVVYQLWKFIAAGLYPTERRVFMLMAPASAVLSVLGVAFLYYIMLPATLVFLIQFSTTYPTPASSQDSWLGASRGTFMHVNEHASGGFNFTPKTIQTTQPQVAAEAISQPTFIQSLTQDPPQPINGQIWFNTSAGQLKICLAGVVRSVALSSGSLMTPLIGVDEYLNLVVGLALVICVSFQIPVFMGLIGGTGLINPDTLAKYRRYVFLGSFVLGLFLTPSQDLFSDVAIPLLIYSLFEVGLVMMRLMRRKPDADDLDAPNEGPMGE